MTPIAAHRESGLSAAHRGAEHDAEQISERALAGAHSGVVVDAGFTRGERLADALVHGVGVTASLAAGVWLVAAAWAEGTVWSVLALTAYAAAMIGMFFSSAAYNLTRGLRCNERLRQADHAVIFFAIAGTYTPLLLRLSPGWAVPSLVFVWSVAIAGAALKFLAPRRHERVGLALYLALGWVGLPLAPALSGLLQRGAALLIVAGVVVYMLGVVAYLAERQRYHNVVWHVMVLAAAGCHYAAMWVEYG